MPDRGSANATQEIPHPEFPHLFVHRIVARFMFLHCLNTNWSLGQLTGLQHIHFSDKGRDRIFLLPLVESRMPKNLEGLLKDSNATSPVTSILNRFNTLKDLDWKQRQCTLAEYLQTTVSKHIAKHITVTDFNRKAVP